MGVFLFTIAFFFTSPSPRDPVAISLTVLAVLALPLTSVAPAVGTVASVVVTWIAASIPQETGLLATMAAWGVVAMLLARGQPRWMVYSLACMITLPVLLTTVADEPLWSRLVWPAMVGVPCIVLGEMLRFQREQARSAARRRLESRLRQRRLMASELHDTVARDLTYAVLMGEQFKIAHADDEQLSRELDVIIEPVRMAVAQLRRGLRSMSTDDGDDVVLRVASRPPRPLAQTLADADRVLADRGARLETDGTQLLTESIFTPGAQQQVLRVINELVDNAAKHTPAEGLARITIETDDRALDCMVTNTVDAAHTKDRALSSGLGLADAQRRVESLGGDFVINRGESRWTVTFSVPVRGAAAG
ncbi:sensor histidine kinase [Actinomyces procaprae]|uniref:sensor histidine kinase n=2 Tax=Actinomyces procaprae TaxID=2560010 RepID=UPI001447A9C5|nr:ATP-binding protein [Actinomyces procaprae]